VFERVSVNVQYERQQERKKGRYASLDIIGKKGEKMDAYV